LFLHITGRRADGYHLLESLFIAINWYDQLTVWADASGQIQREGDLAWPREKDLAVRAAQALRSYAVSRRNLSESAGCLLRLEKSIPHGAGLGGGSADAAYTLRELNRMWNLHYPSEILQSIGLALGADVPFFLCNQAAYAVGVGEQLTPMAVKSRWFVVAVPPVVVPTAVVFQDPLLARSTPPLGHALVARAADSAVWTLGRNDLEPVARFHYAEVAVLLDNLRAAGESLGLSGQACRMSGSGGAVFLSCANEEQAHQAESTLRKRCEQRASEAPGKNAGITIRICQAHF
jgi:4-diphosphocytidyl-2-C-methyl-D-erythritol kinase